jgi:hypothetical protein
MKLSQVQQKLFDSYHGNPVQALLPAVKECLSGNQGFNALWDRGEENSSLTLKSSMTQKDDVLYTSGTSFNQLSLSTAHQSMQVLIDGRALYSLATTALKIGKKALSVELSAYKDGKLPSGWNDEDLDKFILDGMWTMPVVGVLIDCLVHGHIQTSNPRSLKLVTGLKIKGGVTAEVTEQSNEKH